MNRFELVVFFLIVLVLAFIGSYNPWLARQSIKNLHFVSGTVNQLVDNPFRRGENHIRHELMVGLRGQSEMYIIPVRYEPAIPTVLEKVRLGDSITVYYPTYGVPSLRKSIEITHLVCKGEVLLDFHRVQAASRRTAAICAVGVGVNVVLLFLAHRKKQLRRWWSTTRNSRRFFA